MLLSVQNESRFHHRCHRLYLAWRQSAEWWLQVHVSLVFRLCLIVGSFLFRLAVKLPCFMFIMN
ncbi:hypothetical protein E2C01_026687 [Portunus trituberculatus]|uniref:Uncharacterized protein n=1 Tax=Portunus trituberculatus TaxID=210409 RepID=A0A5B7EG77_PORTR|nr:hypothetical protein [Portunus trituberculatus]